MERKMLLHLFVVSNLFGSMNARCTNAHCPETCKCIGKPPTVDCTGRNLNSIPHISSSTEILLLARNNLSAIHESDFAACRNIRTLDLSSNKITTIANGSFTDLHKLQRLNLQTNRIDINDTNRLPLGSLDSLASLIELSFGENIYERMVTYRADLLEYKPLLKVIRLDAPPGVVELPGVFSKLGHLRSLALYGGITELGNNTLASLRGVSVQNFGVLGGNLGRIDVMALSHLAEVTSLDFSNNQALSFDVRLYQAWAGLKYTKIRRLYLRHVSSFTGSHPTPPISEEFFRYLNETPLAELYLDYNGLSSIRGQFHELLPGLQKLSLSYNSFYLYIPPLFDDIYGLKNLTYLDMSFQSPFPETDGMTRMRPHGRENIKAASETYEKQLISNIFTKTAPDALRSMNKNNGDYGMQIFPDTSARMPRDGETYIGMDVEVHKRQFIPVLFPPNLRTLNLSNAMSGLHLEIRILLIFTDTTFMDVIDLSQNSIGSVSQGFVVSPPHAFQIGYLNLSYCGLSLIKLSNGTSFSVDTIDLSHNNLAEQYKMDSTGTSMLQTARAYTKDLRLSYNGIKDLPFNFFMHSRTLQRIHLNNNALRVWNTTLKFMPNMTFLDLSDNLLSSLLPDICAEFDEISKHGYFSVNLKGNPMQCDCYTLYFLKWLITTKVQANNLHEYQCDYKNSLIFMNNLTSIIHNLAIDCASTTWIKVSGAMFGAMILCMFLSVILYRHRWDIRYGCLKLVRQRKEDQLLHDGRNFQFDAFVAYHQKDLSWIIHNLQPQLEAEPNPLRLCIHHRNWLPGPTIEENISRSVEVSYKTLIVLSKNFIHSSWCELEMQLARMRGLEEGDEIAVVVALEEIPLKEMSRTLTNLRRTNTWLDWYEYENDREHFWGLLKDALTRHRGVDGGEMRHGHEAFNRSNEELLTL